MTLRGMTDFGTFSGGVFLGYGIHDDYGDSDENMYYKYIGLDASTMLGAAEVFGQVGYLDWDDEYDEGTQHAPFLRLGAAYSLADDLTVSGAVSFAGGRKYGDSL